MKKLIIIPIVISGTLLFLAGSALMGYAIYKGVKDRKTNNETKEFVIEEDFTKFDIDINTSNLSFHKTEDGTKKVVYEVNEKVTTNVKIEDSSLKIIQKEDNTKWWKYIFFNPKTNIDVYLPVQEFVSLTIKNDTGDISMVDGYSFESIDVKSSTGDAKFSTVNADQTKIEASTGNIEISEMETKGVDVKASTGKIKLNKVNVEENIVANLSTGDITLNEVKAKNLDIKTSTGKQIYTNTIITENIKAKASTGDITFNDSDAETLDIETDTGDVRGTLLTGKTFQCFTDTGKVRVPETTGGICKVKTDTGDIILSVK